MNMLLGAVADDLTGATDLALTLSREGMRTVQTVGVPADDFDFGDAEAVVIALKSRTIPAAEAIAMSLEAARLLKAHGAEQIIFKYCSTFDSTPQGNIGPVAEALLEELGGNLTLACPAFPTNGRTVYRGHLFVGDQLLSDSPMKDHPLTPMTDSDLVRVLQQQTTLPVGLVIHDAVSKGHEAVAAAFKAAASKGEKVIIVDAITNDDLRAIGKAAADMTLITGGSGIAIGLPENFRRAGKLAPRQTAAAFAGPAGPAVMLAGSCSTATRRQVETAIAAGTPAMKLDPLAIADGRNTADAVIDWVKANSSAAIPLVYSSSDPEDVKKAQDVLGRDRAGAVVEHLLADVAIALRNDGYRRFLVAGGETSGAVVNGLGVEALFIGPEIDPGVPWTLSLGDEAPLALALKSGNFGSDDFFLKAWELMR
ncbi:four-carbon acid sugar kinase family protein [Mesorhizobium sp. CGMCC 1.15528]|uniref:3-oxo-tetronate kinase n=1 Tax=Mesorhizobium zhangyense TaxID=1776730 RepID=A0A7C9VBP8_9HYPH|nr:3-oxo-tetronate kinase [Mesorhizobium zhangyense]NGN41727.1 four-carbon acid sugar kinase family protein [Mesorhizobium zhangyense]